MTVYRARHGGEWRHWAVELHQYVQEVASALYRWVVLISAVLSVQLAVLVAQATAAAGDPVFPETVTYQGQIEETSNPVWNSRGGTVMLTFDSENRVVRAELRDFAFALTRYNCSPCIPIGEDVTNVNRVMHQSVDGSNTGNEFAIGLPYIEIGMGRSSFVVQGTVDNTGARGTVEMSCLITPCTLDAPFTATEVIDTAPADTDTIVEAAVESGGTILFALNSNESVTALALNNVLLTCGLEHRFNAISFHDAPGTFDIAFRVGIYYGVSVSGSKLRDGSWFGTLELRRLFSDECEEDVRWSSVGSDTEAPTITPQVMPPSQPTAAAPALPATGQRAERGNPMAAALLVVLLYLGAASTTAWLIRRP